MVEFTQQLLNGLFQGAIYALIALGYTMVYGVLRFINFAHGDVFMLGAYSGLYLSKSMGPMLDVLWWPLGLLSIMVLSMLLCAALGMLIERLAYRPLRDRPRLNVLITAIGVSLFLEYTGQKIFGSTPRFFPSVIPDENLPWAANLHLTVSLKQLIVLVVTVALLFGLRYIVMSTRMGLAMRAVSLNPTAATLMGVNNNVVISFTFGLGSALAAAGGILYASLYPSIDPFMGVLPGIKAFVAAVLGGIGNIPGAALGGLIIGVTETLVQGYGQKVGVVGLLAVAFGIGSLICWGRLVVMAFKNGSSRLVQAIVFTGVGAFVIGWSRARDWNAAKFMIVWSIFMVGLLILQILASLNLNVSIPSGYKDGVAFIILILILLFRPSGLLGRVEREKV